MDFHISKSVAVLMVLSLIIGGAIGGAAGFMAGSEEGHGDHQEMNDRGNKYDSHSDGETNDDMGGASNQDEQQPMKKMPIIQQSTSVESTTSAKTIN